MSSILALKDYGNSSGSSSGDEDSDDVEGPGSTDHTNSSPKAGKSMPVPSTAPITLPSQSQAVKTGEIVLKAAPEVLPNAGLDLQRHIDPSKKEIMYNPKTEELFAPEVGPVNPFKTKQQQAPRNSLAGYVEPAHVSEFQFETQRRTFASYGYAIDPTSDEGMADGTKYIGQVEDGKDLDLTVFHAVKARPGDKRKKERNDDPTDLEGFKGPWAKYVGEQTVAKPTEEEAAEIEERLSKRQKKGKPVTEERMVEEKAVIHIDDVRDYQGRSFLHAPHDLDVNLRADNHPDRCFLPKKHIHTWQAHNKGVCAIRWFPRTAHLMLSCGMDSKIKLYEVYKDRRCIATYSGHKQAVRDCCFNNAGTQFLSASYDRYIKLWDTETGKVVSRFNSRKIPYCVKFNPDGNKQHLFVAGTADKKILCWDTRSGEIVQEYDRHLGAVNTITFVDNNRRFVSTSDDKSMRVWEWNIPVDMKYIADPTMHSMPAVTLSPTGKWLACQSMDNKISIFSAFNRYKLNRKKFFTGHMVAGYACSIDFSPDMSYLMSGDADGKVFVWDWKTTKLFSKWKAHDGVCIGVLWHPHETSKVASAGWDGVIKLWD